MNQPTFRSLSLRLLATLALGAATCSLLSCSPSPAREPNALRPIDEGRAIKLIAQTLHSQGLTPLPPRDVYLSDGVQVRLDVEIQARKLGVVYLTAADVEKLNNQPLATKPTNDDRLIIRNGWKADSDMRVVVLYASDYSYDDNVGQEREATAITAENKLERDVRDFVVIANKNHWP